MQSKVASSHSLKTVEDTNEGLDEGLEDFLEDNIEMDALDPALRMRTIRDLLAVISFATKQQLSGHCGS